MGGRKTWVSGQSSGSPGAQVLEDLYVDQRLTYKQIGGRYGVTATTVMRWMKKAGISARTRSEIASGTTRSYSPEALERLRAGAEKARARISADSRRKQSETRKRLGLGGQNKGKPMSEEQRQKLIAQRADPEYRRRQSEWQLGERSPNWRGGSKPEHSALLDRAEWRRIRRAVYERDNWTCQDCGSRCLNTRDSKTQPKRKIQCHHIIRRRDGGGDTLDNLVTLCMSCHHGRERRYDDALFA